MESKGTGAGMRAARPWVGRAARAVPREQSGAVLVLCALMMVVLIGFLGLVIDVGHQMARYREAQNVADAAALAGAYSIYDGDSMDVARAKATLAAQQNSIGTGSLTLSFLGSDAATAATSATTTYYVQADVSASFPTFLVRALGLVNQSVATTARAEVANASACDLCVMNSSTPSALTLTGGGTIQGQNIGIVVDSNASGAMVASGGGTVTDTGTNGAINIVGTDTLNGGGTISPTPNTGQSYVPDPLAYLPSPSPSSYTSYSTTTNRNDNGVSASYKLSNFTGCSGTLNPGVYEDITDECSGTLTLNPGIYIITGSFSVTGSGNVVGLGVMLYFTCASTTAPRTAPLFTSCSSASTTGGSLNLAGTGKLDLSGYSDSSNVNDPYNGMLVYYDRADTSDLVITGNGDLNSATASVTGTIYGLDAGKNSKITGQGSLTTTVDSLIVVNQLTLSGNTGSGLVMKDDRSLQAKPKVYFGLVN